MDELAQAFAARAAESRGQIRNLDARQVAREPVEERIPGAAPRRRLRRAVASANDEVVFTEARDDAPGFFRRVLAVGVEDEDEVAGGVADAGFDRGPVALGVRMAHDLRASGHRRVRGPVARPVVNDDDFAPVGAGAQPGDDAADGTRFVHRGNHDRDRRCVGQGG